MVRPSQFIVAGDYSGSDALFYAMDREIPRERYGSGRGNSERYEPENWECYTPARAEEPVPPPPLTCHTTDPLGGTVSAPEGETRTFSCAENEVFAGRPLHGRSSHRADTVTSPTP